MGQSGSTTHHYHPHSHTYLHRNTNSSNCHHYRNTYTYNDDNNINCENGKMHKWLSGEYTSMCAAPLVDEKNNGGGGGGSSGGECSGGIGFIACCRPHSMIIESYSSKEEALNKARHYKDKNFDASLHAYKTYLDLLANNNNSSCFNNRDSKKCNHNDKLHSCTIEMQKKNKNCSSSPSPSRLNSDTTADETEANYALRDAKSNNKNNEKDNNNTHNNDVGMIIMNNQNGSLMHKLSSSSSSFARLSASPLPPPPAPSSSLSLSPTQSSDSGVCAPPPPNTHVSIPVLCLDRHGSEDEKEEERKISNDTNGTQQQSSPPPSSSFPPATDQEQSGESSTTVYSSNKSSRLHSSDSAKMTSSRNELFHTDSSFSSSSSMCLSSCPSGLSSFPTSTSITLNNNDENPSHLCNKINKMNDEMLDTSSCFCEKSRKDKLYEASIYDEIAQLCFSNSYCAEALVWYDKALALDEENPAYLYRKGVVLQSLGYVQAATSSFIEALKYDDKYKPAIFNLGVVKRNEHPEEALKYFTQLLLIEPENTEVMGLMAACHEDQGRLTEAIAYLTRVVELDENNFGVKRNLQKMQAKANALAK